MVDAFSFKISKRAYNFLSCMICCTSIVLGQTKQAQQNYEAGLIALDKKDTEKAIQLFKLAASKDSQYLDPAIALFQIYQEQKNFESAIDYFNAIKKIDSVAAVPFIVKQGVALASLGKYDAAYQLLTPYIQNNSLPNYLKEKQTHCMLFVHLRSNKRRRQKLASTIWATVSTRLLLNISQL